MIYDTNFERVQPRLNKLVPRFDKQTSRTNLYGVPNLNYEENDYG